MNGIETALKKMKSSRQTVVLTGAGISTGSGIPDFRGGGGLWKKYDPAVYAHIDGFRSDPGKVWELSAAFSEIVKRAEPDSAHIALAELETAGLVHAIITQNIDDLHKRAGSRNVIPYHGEAGWGVCPGCGLREPFTGDGAPLCGACGRVMKPAFTLFGEPVPAAAFLEAKNLASFSDVFIVAGTSVVVQPAAELPYIAKENGAYIIEFNLEYTGITNYITDCFIQGPVEETLPRFAAGLMKSF